MAWFDLVILVIVALSSAVSLRRGFVKEALSLVAWIAAFLVSTAFAQRFSLFFEDIITNDALRYVVAYMSLFAGCLLLGAMLNGFLARVIEVTGLSNADRFLGVAFGFARGLLLVLIVIFILQTVLSYGERGFLRKSRLVPYLEDVEQWAREKISDADIELEMPSR